MNNIKVENVGHVMAHPQVVRAGNITEPSFNYINQVALNSGMGRLAEELSYQKAVAAMEMKKGENALNKANVEAAAAEAETQGALKGTEAFLEEIAYLHEKNRQATQEKLSILEQQKKFFDSITTSNILSEYNEQMFQARQEDLENNPGGEGHLERMAKAHDELVKKYLSGSLDPGIKQVLTSRLKEAGAHVANQAFQDEQTRTVARAKLALDDALEKATLHVANGMNPEEAIKELDPIMESIPNSMPWKAEALKKARSELIEYSLKRTAMINPTLAARNMSMVGGIYAELSSQQRLSVEKTIKAVQADIADKEIKAEDKRITAQIANHSGEVSKCYEDIWRGACGYAELEARKDELTPQEYSRMEREIGKRNEMEKEEIKKQLVVEAKAAKDGNYYSFTPGEQNEIWLRKIQTEQFAFMGEAVNSGNRLQSYAKELAKFNVPIPIIKRDLKVNMLYGTAEQATDATLAFRELYATNRRVLGREDDEVKAMLDFSTMLEDGVTIAKAQEKMQEDLAPIYEEEKKKLDESFNGEFSSKMQDWGGARRADFSLSTFQDELKNYGIEFDEQDFTGLRTAERLARSYYIATRGDNVRTLQMTAAAINASYRPSTINGPGAEDYRMWQAPEGLFAGKGYADELVRKVFCNRAAQLAAESIGDEQGWLEILPVEEGKPNQCIYYAPTGAKLAGTFWFEHVPGTVGRYRVKYSYNRGFGGYNRNSGAGFWLTRKNSAGEDEAVTVDIDDLDWDLSLSPMLAFNPVLVQEMEGAK